MLAYPAIAKLYAVDTQLVFYFYRADPMVNQKLDMEILDESSSTVFVVDDDPTSTEIINTVNSLIIQIKQSDLLRLFAFKDGLTGP